MTADDGPRRPVELPAAFVHYEPALGRVVEDVPLPGDEESTAVFQRNSFSMLISREMALDFGLVEPTEEEREERERQLAEFRRKEALARAVPGPELTLEAVLERLGWSAEFAAHWLHPACHCDALSDDPSLCSWADELGFTIDWKGGGCIPPCIS